MFCVDEDTFIEIFVQVSLSNAVTNAEVKIESSAIGNLATTSVTNGSVLAAFYRGKIDDE